MLLKNIILDDVLLKFIIYYALMTTQKVEIIKNISIEDIDSLVTFEDLSGDYLSLRILENGEPTMSNRIVAHITGKRHSMIIQTCDVLNKKYKDLTLSEISAGVR